MLNLDVVRQLANGPAPHPTIAGRIVSPSVLLQLVDAIEEGRAAQAELAQLKAQRPAEYVVDTESITLNTQGRVTGIPVFEPRGAIG